MAERLVRRLSLLDLMADRTIELYQRWISPRKGFVCAHRTLHGGLSCSQFARVTIAQAGLRGLRTAMRTRFGECREASLSLRARTLHAKGQATELHDSDLDGAPSSIKGEIEGGENRRRSNRWCGRRMPDPVCCYIGDCSGGGADAAAGGGECGLGAVDCGAADCGGGASCG